jgi:hypothetical protein
VYICASLPQEPWSPFEKKRPGWGLVGTSREKAFVSFEVFLQGALQPFEDHYWVSIDRLFCCDESHDVRVHTPLERLFFPGEK